MAKAAKFALNLFDPKFYNAVLKSIMVTKMETVLCRTFGFQQDNVIPVYASRVEEQNPVTSLFSH